MSSSTDIQIKFDGSTVRLLDGAPADAVIRALSGLQRMVHIIGMSAEGKALGLRLKPSAKVRREYAVVCRNPERGSHIQPFNVATEAGKFTPAAMAARDKLLQALKAFDSGDDQRISQAVPNARERWFLADAALCLLPDEESGIEIGIRAGSHGPFSFKADRAADTIRRYRTGPPPSIDTMDLAGKLITIDYNRTILTIKPSHGHAIRLDYPLQLEHWLQQNVRKRLKIVGIPRSNERGDVTGFKSVSRIVELEPSLEHVTSFETGDRVIRLRDPIRILAGFDYEDRLFIFQDEEKGIDVFTDDYAGIRDLVIKELGDLWINYAEADDSELAADALRLKRNLLRLAT